MATPVPLESRNISDVLAYTQSQVFSKLVRKMQVNTPVITAVYYRRRDTLVLPGSNLTAKQKTVASANELTRVLKEHCPHPDNSDVGAQANRP